MDHIDLKYCGVLNSRLERFKVKSNFPYRANFRCPLCGDSKISSNKTRGWILEKSNKAFYYCHNCFKSVPLQKFIEEFDVSLYQQYVIDMAMERMPRAKKDKLEADTDSKFKMKPPVFSKTPKSNLVTKISKLRHDHPAKKYIQDRQIPSDKHYLLYYAPKFKKYVNSIMPKKLDEKYEEARIVFPFYDKNNKMFGLSGRSLNPKSNLKYMMIMFDDKHKKIYGLERVDTQTKYYITEGQIDSLFLPNSIAMAGADISYGFLENSENGVVIFDNESRNPSIVAKMKKTLEQGMQVVIWPAEIPDNDINDMIKSGFTKEQIKQIIDANTYSGMEGLLALTIWKRC